MKSYAGLGWKSVKDQFYVIILLFLYRLLWGYGLYRIIKSAVVPLLMRYPDPAPNELSKLLYFFEGEMELMHGDTVQVYAWLLIGMLLTRMVLTPLIHAGIYYNLHQEAKGERGLFFFRGIRRLWKPVVLFYLVQLLLTLAPAYWVVPEVLPELLASLRDPSRLISILPYLIGWLVYACLIRLVLLYMQFGTTASKGMFSAAFLCFRHFNKAAGLMLMIGGTACSLSLLFSGLSLWWAGLAGLMLHQASYFISSLFQLWGITAQYHVWSLHSPNK